MFANVLTLKGRGKDTEISPPLTDKELASVDQFRIDLLKIDNRIILQKMKGKILHNTTLEAREINKKIELLDQHVERLEKSDKAKKDYKEDELI